MIYFELINDKISYLKSCKTAQFWYWIACYKSLRFGNEMTHLLLLSAVEGVNNVIPSLDEKDWVQVEPTITKTAV